METMDPFFGVLIGLFFGSIYILVGLIAVFFIICGDDEL